MSLAPSTRRRFLKTLLATGASLVLPRGLPGKQPVSSWFLHTPAGDFWPVDDPVAWFLANADRPLRERARKRLAPLGTADSQLALRLVSRPCDLDLVEVQADRVAFHSWHRQGLNGWRSCCEVRALPRDGVEATRLDRKRKGRGDDLLDGETTPEKLNTYLRPLAVYWLQVYWNKWKRRDEEERDDGKAAPGTWSEVEPGSITWAALKSVWRHAPLRPCASCDEPTILVNRDFHFCRNCQRLSHDYSVDGLAAR